MLGTDAETGKPLTGLDHLRQSVRDILTTPLGSRVMRRDYGSRLFELVDRPLNRATIAEFYAATAEALRKWEPRLRLLKVNLEEVISGKATLSIEALYLPTGERVTIQKIKTS